MINKTKLVVHALTNAPFVGHLNCGSCNGCDIEILAVLTPRFDVERFGVVLEGTPRHVDVLLCTGPVTRQNEPRVKRVYEQTADPKFVVAVGTCACTGGVYQECYSVVTGPDGKSLGLDKTLPVAAYIPGCPPRPEAILDGVVKLIVKARQGAEEAGEEE
ncbi:MAG: NADH-quinone oxidoreductase subunit B family protein [Candidatus Hodarchaeales archaeon]|jgi:Ni,Fe-hydrogenase III small subunit